MCSSSPDITPPDLAPFERSVSRCQILLLLLTLGTVALAGIIAVHPAARPCSRGVIQLPHELLHRVHIAERYLMAGHSLSARIGGCVTLLRLACIHAAHDLVLQPAADDEHHHPFRPILFLGFNFEEGPCSWRGADLDAALGVS